MKILRLEIREFGGITGATYELGSGINVISGAGSELIPAFIRFILYGLPRAKDAAGGFDRTMAFGSAGVAEGAMDVSLGSADGAEVRVERYISTARPGDELCIVSDAETGAELWRGASAGEFLFGVPASVFDRLCLSPIPGDGKDDFSSVSDALGDILIPPTDAQNTAKALNRVRGARRRLLSDDGQSGRIAELRAERADLKARLENAKECVQNRISLGATVEKYTRVTNETADRLADAEDVCTAYEDMLALRRFDELHEAQGRLDALRKEETDLIDAQGFRGKYPDDAYAAALSLTADNILRAGEEIAETEREMTAIANDASENGQDMYADEIVSAGGADAVADNYNTLAKKHHLLRTGGVSLLGAGIMIFVVSLAAYFLLSGSVSWMNLPFTLALAIAGVLMTVAGCMILRLAAESGAAVGNYVEKFGLDPAQYRNGDVASSTAQIRKYAAFCVRVKKERSGRRSRQRELSSVSAEKRAWLASSKSEGRALLAQFGTADTSDSDTSLAQLLRTASAEASEKAAKMNRLNAKIKAEDAIISRLRADLADRDEAQMREIMTPDVLEMLSAANYDTLKFKRDAIAAQLEAGKVRLREAQKNLAAIEAKAENPARAANDLGEVERELAAAEESLAALTLAQEKLEKAPAALIKSIPGMVRESAGKILALLSGDRYTDVATDENLCVSDIGSGRVRLKAPFDGADADLAELAMRDALTDLLFRRELPPFICDTCPAPTREGAEEEDSAPRTASRERIASAVAAVADLAADHGADSQTVILAADKIPETVLKALDEPFASVTSK